jgi:diguanylate cyclase (GGDEF)-like protein
VAILRNLRYRVLFWISVVLGIFIVGLLFFHLEETRLSCGNNHNNFIYLIAFLLVAAITLSSWAVHKIIVNQKVYSCELEARTNKMRELAVIDGLTKVYNHRYFEHKLEKEWERFERYRHSLSCIMIDIDNFKSINDTFGHRSGDIVLRGIADLLRESLRDIDIISRYGGEEFTIICFEKPNTTDGLKRIMEKIRKKIAAEKFNLGEQKIQITASLGGAMVPNSKIISPEQLVHFADKAMYSSKKNGKNASKVFEEKDCC